MTAGTVLALRAGSLSAGITTAGGALLFLRSDSPGGPADWLRPAGDAPESPLSAACFPMLPFFSRIAGDRLESGGRTARLPAAGHGFSHAIHGFGWLSDWQVEQAGESELVLGHDNASLPPQVWPWRYRARQHFTLASSGLAIALALTNEDDVPMPAGLGLHPFFPTHGLRLQTDVAAMHVMDADGLPCRADAQAPAIDAFRAGGRLPSGLDNIFEGWSGHAVLGWRHGRLLLRAEGFGFLCVYSPPGAGFACIEPVTHTTNAARFGAVPWGQSGARMLAPGETMAVAAHFYPLPAA